MAKYDPVLGAWQDAANEIAVQRDAARAELAVLRARAEQAEADLAANDEEFTQVMRATEGETKRATARVALLEGLLREVEWAAQNVDDDQCCPVCEGLQYSATLSYGHDSDCRLAAALADTGEAR